MRYHFAFDMRLVRLHFLFIIALGFFLGAAVSPLAYAQEIDSVYGPLPVFEFHSGFWVNLHHFLYHEARARQLAKDQRDAGAKTSGPVLRQTPGSTVSLSPAEQKALGKRYRLLPRQLHNKRYAGEHRPHPAERPVGRFRGLR